MAARIGVVRVLMVLLAVACSAGVGCGTRQFPTVEATPPPDAARGLRVLLTMSFRNNEDNDWKFKWTDAIAEALKDAGMVPVLQDNPEAPPEDIYDFTLQTRAYSQDGHQSGVWEIDLASVARLEDGRAYSWELRRDEANGGNIHGPDALTPMKPCFDEWTAEASGRKPRTGKLSWDTRVDSHHRGFLLGVNGPDPYNLRSLPEEAPSHQAAARFLINKLVGCPGFAPMAEAIRDSGVGASARMDALPTHKLMNLCRSFAETIQDRDQARRYDGSAQSLLFRPGSQDPRTGQWVASVELRNFGDACEVASRRDPVAAQEVRQLRQKRQAQMPQWEQEQREARAQKTVNEAAREQREEAREAQAEEAKRLREQQEEQMRQQHDATMAQLPGAIAQSAAVTRQAIAPVQSLPSPVIVRPRAEFPREPIPSAGPSRGASPSVVGGGVVTTHPGGLSQPSGISASTGGASAAGPAASRGNGLVQSAAGGSTGSDAAKQAALQQCLAQPVTPMTVTRTNPFLSYAQTFQSLLDKARGACASAKTPSDWQNCIGDNAMGALWAFEPRAVADQATLASWYPQVASYYTSPAPVCMWGQISGTRVDCLGAAGVDVVRNQCVLRLQADIDMMNCDYRMFPGVGAAQDKRTAVEAKQKHDADCRSRAAP